MAEALGEDDVFIGCVLKALLEGVLFCSCNWLKVGVRPQGSLFVSAASVHWAG